MSAKRPRLHNVVGLPTQKPTSVPSVNQPGEHDLLVQLDAGLQVIADAAPLCDALIKGTAAQRFAVMSGARVAIVLERHGSTWKSSAKSRDAGGAPTDRMLRAIPASSEIVRIDEDGVFVPVKPGSLGVLLCSPSLSERGWVALKALASGFDLALSAAAQSQAMLDTMDEISGLQQIARRILCAAELDEVLFSITRETQRLLSADICGIFLREDDEIVMRGCVGNMTLEIERVRMLRGQGLAGRVFETGRFCKVDDYLNSDLHNRDYLSLVQNEHIRAALGVPLRVRDNLIGVLEVWRRRGAKFTEQDVRCLSTLGNLTAIAIENARLYDMQRAVVQKLTLTSEDLQRQNDIIKQSASIQEAVIQSLLNGEGLPGISRVVAGYSQAQVAILSLDLQVMASHPASLSLERFLPEIARSLEGGTADGNNATLTTRSGEKWISLRPIVAGRGRVGWIFMLSDDQPAEVQEVAFRQAAVASALSYLEQRAASHARARTLGGLMWDLVEGASDVRLAAISRAKDFHVDLSGPHRIVHCMIDRKNEGASSDGWSNDALERARRTVQEACERSFGSSALKLIAGRGNLLVLSVAAEDIARTTQMLKAVGAAIGPNLSGLKTLWGVSAPCANAMDYVAAHREAAAAALAAKQLRAGNVAFHEQLGVVGLLLTMRDEYADLRQFVSNVLGPVIKYDLNHHDTLTKTVQAYFDCDYAQHAAAKKLHVHEKTIRYRLTRFEELTGLKLDHHETRVLVALALQMHAISAGMVNVDTGDRACVS